MILIFNEKWLNICITNSVLLPFNYYTMYILDSCDVNALTTDGIIAYINHIFNSFQLQYLFLKKWK